MRNPLAIIIGLVVAALVAWLGCEIVDEANGAPDFLCTAIWVVALLAWLVWAFGDMLSRRA